VFTILMSSTIAIVQHSLSYFVAACQSTEAHHP
jgi:hypothetical protein